MFYIYKIKEYLGINIEGFFMCEFKVILEGKIVFKDAIYAKVDGSTVIVKDILGDLKELNNCRIIEVDVNAQRLILSPLKR
jgi:predicted RNA-binding protein